MSVETVETFPTEQKFDDQELFDHAEAVEAPDTPVVTEQTQQTEQAANEQTETLATTETETEKVAAEEAAGRVPAFRLREEAEARRRLETDLANERAERAALKQRLDALERQPKEQPKEAERPSRPDPLLDPDGFAAAVRQELREEALNERREESLLKAREANQQEFDEAYAWAQKAVDPALKARMQSSRDPGKTLLETYREQKTRQEIGGDLTAYKQRLRDEALKDPEFRKAAMEAWRSDAQTQQNGRPNVALPPSLSGASRSSLSATIDTDISDEGLWQHVNS